MRRALTVLLVACGSSRAAPQQVTILPAPSSSSAEAHVEPPYVEDARTAFDAAEALERAGSINEARVAYAAIVRKWAYTRSAKDALERLARLDALSTIGDVTCAVDADCAVTTKRDCCECCPRRALATSKKWLVWRDGQCATTRCEGCDKTCEPETGANAVCREGRCALVRRK